MRKLIMATGIGIAAGIIDVIPMLAQGIDRYANASAFAHWVGMGIIISYVKMDMKGWQRGILIALISTVPIMLIVLKDNPASILPIAVMTVLLGALIGFFSDRYVR